jgi:AcrR family transcriptional regulator
VSTAGVTPQLRQPAGVLGVRATRTISAILDATRQIFLVRGYAATIDEIARAAGVSRASFYTYFPSKRDVLLALGAETLQAARRLVEAFEMLPAEWSEGEYLEMLDEHGSFVFAWTQAAQDDEAIRSAGMRGHLALCRRMGKAMATLGGQPAKDPAERGLLAFSMLERGWAYWQLYQGPVKKAAIRRSMARMLGAVVAAG